MFSDLKNIPSAWAKAFSNRSFRMQLLITIVIFLFAGFHNFHYLRIWQMRGGVQINDYVLNMMPPHDFSVEIFIVEYSTLFLVFFLTLPKPDLLIKALQMAAIIFFARTLCIYLLPLEPPRDMVNLEDPMANFFLHSKDVFVTKDLFFSGH